MVRPDLTSEDTVRALACDRLKWPDGPWKSRRPEIFFKTVCRELCRGSVQSRIEWNHYGSGYASFVDAWFYKDNPDFEVKTPDGDHRYIGLWVLLHRLSPFYVVGQGEKRWSKNSGASYVPGLKGVDDIGSKAVLQLSGKIDRRLSKHGFVRLRNKEVRHSIPQDIHIETNLNSGDFHLFDALFHWMD